MKEIKQGKSNTYSGEVTQVFSVNDGKISIHTCLYFELFKGDVNAKIGDFTMLRHNLGGA